jgi:acylphosphatase
MSKRPGIGRLGVLSTHTASYVILNRYRGELPGRIQAILFREVLLARVRIVVKGIVQGVGFRYFTLDLARRLGLSGFVRNRVDGSVEVEVEGKEAVIKALIEDLRTGPRAAHVTGIDVEQLPPGANYDGFELRF